MCRQSIVVEGPGFIYNRKTQEYEDKWHHKFPRGSFGNTGCLHQEEGKPLKVYATRNLDEVPGVSRSPIDGVIRNIVFEN